MAKKRELRLTHARLVELIDYDPETGSMVWRRGNGRSVRAGAPAGGPDAQGYLRAVIDLEILPGHRIAWFYVHKVWPDGHIKFVDKNPLNLRIKNLVLRNKSVDGDVPFSPERLRALLDYNPDTGLFVWKVDTARVPAGSIAGTIMKIGYRIMSVDGQKYLAHRLAWFYVHNEWPENMIDHINGDRSDNRIVNLRKATSRQNSINGPLRSTNTSGLKGVSWANRRKKWTARITSEYRVHVLGYFDTKEEAYAAYCEAAQRLHGAFANLGKAPDNETERRVLS